MAQVTEADVYGALAQVKDPDLHKDIVRLGFIKDLKIEGGAVSFRVVLTTPACPVREQLQEQSRAAVAQLPGVTSVSVTMDAEVPKGRGLGEKLAVPGVRNIVAVSSGKGGVGKTTVAVNLAVSLARDGARVGLLDADITGPNVPLMMGTGGAHVTGTNGRVNPVVSHGVKMMSIQYFLTGDSPVIWRGPLIHSAIAQFLRDVEWGELDYLVIDLPPGTGDAALSISQLIPLSGAAIVTTPQEVSLLDARKAIAMFEKVNVRTLGVVENMSAFICPGCGSEHDIFGSGGGMKIARELELEVLGRIPLEPGVRTGSDAGVPITSTQYPGADGSAAAAAMRELARPVARRS